MIAAQPYEHFLNGFVVGLAISTIALSLLAVVAIVCAWLNDRP